MSVKFQVTLPDPLMAELKREAEKIGVPVAELIRQTMDDRLRKGRIRTARDPFEELDGLVQSNEPDLAARVDEMLYASENG